MVLLIYDGAELCIIDGSSNPPCHCGTTAWWVVGLLFGDPAMHCSRTPSASMMDSLLLSQQTQFIASEESQVRDAC